jgi:protein-export membrane protein SecD
MNLIQKNRIRFIAILALGVVAGLVSYPKAVSFTPPLYNFLNKAKINLGLDLQGGIHLEYKADTTQVADDKKDEALQAAQDVIERRINAFGVGEPLVQTAKSGEENRIIVELPGIKDIEGAKEQIKETPFLEFKEEASEEDLKEYEKLFEQANVESKKKAEEVLKRALAGEDFSELAREFSQDPGSKDQGGDLGFVEKGVLVPEFDQVLFEGNLQPGEVYPRLVETQFGWHIIKMLEVRSDKLEAIDENDPVNPAERDNGESEMEVHSAHILFAKQSAEMIPELQYKSTGLTGKNLKTAEVVFATQGLSEPQVSLRFDDEGTKLFAGLTKKNLGKTLAIFLDGQVVSAPTVQSEITNGEAVITGDFSVEEAKKLAGRLNEGALPVPLTLVGQQSVEASLGQESLQKSLYAGIMGLAAVIVFMIAYYRFLGIVASAALLIYTALMIAIIKLSGSFTPWPITLTLSGIAGLILTIGMAVDANILIFERTKEEIRRGKNIHRALKEGFRRAWTSIRDSNISSIITALILMVMATSFVKGFAIMLIIGVLVSMFTAITITRTMLRFLVGDWITEKLWIVGIKKKDKISNI